MRIATGKFALLYSAKEKSGNWLSKVYVFEWPSYWLSGYRNAAA